MDVFFSKSALADLKKLDKLYQRRTRKKLLFFITRKDPLHFAKRIKDSSLGEWRFRIGDYRVLCDAGRGKIIILKVKHRKDVYKKI
jgi:mRNA interferase RelE/StbE